METSIYDTKIKTAPDVIKFDIALKITNVMELKNSLHVRYVEGDTKLGNEFLVFRRRFQELYSYVRSFMGDENKTKFDALFKYDKIFVIHRGRKMLAVNVAEYLSLWDDFVEELVILGILDFGYKKLRPEIAVMKTVGGEVIERCLQRIIDESGLQFETNRSNDKK